VYFKDVKDFLEFLEYRFININLLNTSLTHSSFANENKQESNEKLEFLGDRVLNLIVSAKIYHKGDLKNEGEMDNKRKLLTSNLLWSKYCVNLGLHTFIKISKNVLINETIASGLFESIFGSIFLDSNSLEVTTRCYDKIILSQESHEIDIKYSPLYKYEGLKTMKIVLENNEQSCALLATKNLGSGQWNGFKFINSKLENYKIDDKLKNIAQFLYKN